jgi:hypothetical protein
MNENVIKHILRVDLAQFSKDTEFLVWSHTIDATANHCSLVIKKYFLHGKIRPNNDKTEGTLFCKEISYTNGYIIILNDTVKSFKYLRVKLISKLTFTRRI